ncbi:MAG: nitroreductase family protein [Chloroflexi bacterium]|nr:nitroreductase family protein [Chloroflexota bacterium]
MTDANPGIKLLRGLRAVREFLPQAVDATLVDQIVEVGRWSGSASNTQPTEVIVVRDYGSRQRLMDWGVNHAGGAPVTLVIVTSGNVERRDLELYDEGRLSERLCLAASALGLGSCIGWLKADGPERAKDLLGIPVDRRVVTVISVGYTDVAKRQARARNEKPRKPSSEFVHYERFGQRSA